MEEEKRMRPIFFHYLRLGCLGWFTQLRFRSKDRHNTDGPPSRQAKEKIQRKGRDGNQPIDWRHKRGQKVQRVWGHHDKKVRQITNTTPTMKSELILNQKWKIIWKKCFLVSGCADSKGNWKECLEVLFVLRHPGLFGIFFTCNGSKECCCLIFYTLPPKLNLNIYWYHASLLKEDENTENRLRPVGGWFACGWLLFEALRCLEKLSTPDVLCYWLEHVTALLPGWCMTSLPVFNIKLVVCCCWYPR